jgi:hypothetical protein
MPRATGVAAGGVKKRAAPKKGGAAAAALARALAPAAPPAAPAAAGMLRFGAARKPRVEAASAAADCKPAAPVTPPGSAAPAAPPLLPLPKSTAAADAVVGHLGQEYTIKDAQYGRGLFVAGKPLPAGALIAAYGGELQNARALPAGTPHTHVLRLQGTDDAVNGLTVANGLVRGADGVWRPASAADARAGYASLANAARTEKEANAKMVFVRNFGAAAVAAADGSVQVRAAGRALADLLPPGAYLMAKRPLVAHEEVLWHYQVAYQ